LGIQERKQRDYEKRKALILDSARKLFARKGVTGVTLDDIAREIEFSKGTIYSHFESKEEIYAQILLEHLDGLLCFLKRASDDSRDAEEGIRRSLEAYVRFYDKNREYFKLLFLVDFFGDGDGVPEKLQKEIQFKKVACLAELQRVLKKDPQVSARFENNLRDLAILLWGMINGILQLAETRQIGPQELERLTQLAFDVVTRGLKDNRP
jgi:AcrR family transcriptional regulator